MRPAKPATALTPSWVVVGLAMGPAVALGFARFAYALLLPSMRTALGWSFADAGAMNTANAAGYLIGALFATPIGKRVGDRRVFAASLLLTAVAVSVSGLSADFPVLLALRAIAGFTGALVFVCGAGLASAAAKGGSRKRAPTLLGVYFSGAGIGITASALVVSPLLERVSWRGGWLALGALALSATIFGWWVLDRAPEPAHALAGSAFDGWSPRFMMCILLAYGLFGVGYISYATFIIAYLRSNEGFSAADVTHFWSILGIASVATAFAWGPILGRLKGGWGTAATLCGVTVGVALPLLWKGHGVGYLSAILFGGSFLAVITAVTSFARRAAKPHAWTAAIAALTIALGIGQSVGPVLTGAFSDKANGLRAGLWLSVGILAIATLVAAFQPEPAP
ncbi:putative MFS family arabinose efflux permease [Silvibacterium bohemicum]|uniref:Putative MFS family arabinose efflux permease n=1 Tax=Silvibacterium bohemicum TaxID=1577686 RepID=A0A841JS00_9BACT|nr:YbfB/YjiJ family MFS transporter [Silvibacterium bohemicum]MBB6144162.1 putative MFS family arabinose efflux permease [Silvibacterium bohemicum]